MEKKICPLCKKTIDEDALICPDCGADVEAVSEPAADEAAAQTCDAAQEIQKEAEAIVIPDNIDGEYPQTEEIEKDDDAPEKSSKLVKFVACVLAAILVFFGAKFLWSNFGPGSVINVVTFGVEDVEGTFTDPIYGRYYTFAIGASEFEDERVSASDAEENVSYDGTYESGFTNEYINSVLIQQYIIDNNLTEEYDAYLEDNELIIDDFAGFAKKKKITKEKLDAIDQEYQYIHMGESYTTSGLWKYDANGGAILVYDQDGTFLSALYVKREGLVADSGYMTGSAGFGKTFNAKFVGRDEDYGITETICTYNDGMCISTIVQDDGAEPSYIAGSYKVRDGVIVFNLGDDVMRYRKVTGGLGFLVYTK